MPRPIGLADQRGAEFEHAVGIACRMPGDEFGEVVAQPVDPAAARELEQGAVHAIDSPCAVACSNRSSACSCVSSGRLKGTPKRGPYSGRMARRNR